MKSCKSKLCDYPKSLSLSQEEMLGAQKEEQQGSPLASHVKSKVLGHSTRRTLSVVKPSPVSTPSSLDKSLYVSGQTIIEMGA